MHILIVHFCTDEKSKSVYNTSMRKVTHTIYVYELDPLYLLGEETQAALSYATSKMEYHGNVIYSDGKVDMVLFPGGYATINGSAVTFHYYTQDYLGNNRAVINGSTGAIEQVTAYYPYGGVIADLGTNQTSGQPYKFGGKELITANGLNEYDFGARQYYPAVPHFTRIDPMCESFTHLSHYLFCGNDPLNKVDPTGKVIETIWDIGNVVYDIGAAIYNHVTGDHGTAVENWMDAGFDAAAAIIPGFPAGTSKLLTTGAKAAKSVDKASDVKKGIEITSDISKSLADKSSNSSQVKDALKAGRSGRQARLKELGDDPKLGKADRGWIKQEQNSKRPAIRVPPGKELAHPRGKEAAKVILTRRLNFNSQVIINYNINMIITERKIDKDFLTDKGQYRELVVSKTEFSSLIQCPNDVRYTYTIKRIVNTETIWVLSSKEDNIISLISEGKTYIPLWSSKDYGLSFCQNDLESCDCKAMSLYVFLDLVKESSLDCSILLGVFPTVNDIFGRLVSADEFIQNVDEELEWY